MEQLPGASTETVAMVSFYLTSASLVLCYVSSLITFTPLNKFVYLFYFAVETHEPSLPYWWNSAQILRAQYLQPEKWKGTTVSGCGLAPSVTFVFNSNDLCHGHDPIL